MNRNFLKKEGCGVSRENFEKYHGTFLFFHSQRPGGGWVVNMFHQKSTYTTPSQTQNLKKAKEKGTKGRLTLPP